MILIIGMHNFLNKQIQSFKTWKKKKKKTQTNQITQQERFRNHSCERDYGSAGIVKTGGVTEKPT